jgi:hypothetical protein
MRYALFHGRALNISTRSYFLPSPAEDLEATTRHYRALPERIASAPTSYTEQVSGCLRERGTKYFRLAVYPSDTLSHVEALAALS